MEESDDVHIFNSAAFDSSGGGGSDLKVERSVDMKASWMDLDQKCLSTSIDSDSSKENHNPLLIESPSPAPFKTPISNTLFKTPVEAKTFSNRIGSTKEMINDSTLRNEVMIDKEIKQIEMEMSRLSLIMESLKLEKAERKKQRVRERRCSIVPAKYMETASKQNTSLKKELPLKNQDSNPKQRRGVSLCPAEIYSATKSRQSMTEPDVSNSNMKQNRRQSCFWKLGEIDEVKITKAQVGIGKSVSVSPKLPPRSTVPKLDASKKAATTIGSKKSSQRNDAVLSSVQPKKLFKESEGSRSASAKPIKSGRVIPSRYNHNPTQSPDSVSATTVKSLSGSGSRVKKRWQIPAKENVVVYMNNDDVEESNGSTVCVDEMVPGVLRKIRTVKCVNESPRDSGAVKRVADLVGKKTSFFADGDSEVRQALSFVDEEVDDEDD